MDELFHEMQARYATGRTPWDADQPPPEVCNLAAELAPGRALDLGCGTGRVAVYLAQRGWTVDAVDFVPAAIARATERAQAANVAAAISYHTCSVTALDHLTPGYDLAVDVGCGHALTGADLLAYAGQIGRLVRPDGVLLQFARLRPVPAEDGAHGLDEAEWLAALGPRWTRRCVVYGTTTTDSAPWASAWYWLERLAADDVHR